MITLLPESSDGVLGFRIEGELTDEDYWQGVLPPMGEAIISHEKIRLLLQMKDFRGWKNHGAWDDPRNWSNARSVERMAFLVDDNWREFTSYFLKIYASVSHIDIRFFKHGQLPEAWDWLRSP